jgi:hypothetical protein
MVRSSLFAALSLFALLAPVGCGASSDDDSNTGGSNGALSSTVSTLVGRYSDPTAPAETFDSLTLTSTGTYTAKLVAGTNVRCVIAPCLIPESGKWNGSTVGGKLHLVLLPTNKPAREYDAAKTGDDLVLTSTLDSVSQTLHTVRMCGGIAALQCKAGEECVDDPEDSCNSTRGADCSGICQPKATPKTCGGIAGLQCAADEDCVDDPNDGCDPNKGADCAGTCQPKAAR